MKGLLFSSLLYFLYPFENLQALGESNILVSKAVPVEDPYGSKRMGPITEHYIPSPTLPLTHSPIGPFVDELPVSYGQHLMTHKMRKQLLDAHNYVRKLEAPSAKYMLKMTWDYHLEAYANQWVQYLCTAADSKFFEHSPSVSTSTPAWPWRMTSGENLYTTTGTRPDHWDVSEVVHKWYNEKDYYDWNTGKANSRNAGKPVGHYKQLVRAEAAMVGCSVMTHCKHEGAWRTFVGCQYDYGNLSKDPYERGQGNICQECPNGFPCCEAGLCDGQKQAGGLAPFRPPTDVGHDWYHCSASARSKSDCKGTGALQYLPKIPGDQYNVEHNACLCGLYDHPYDIVKLGVFWREDRCVKATASTGSFVETRHGSLRNKFQHRLVPDIPQSNPYPPIFVDMDSPTTGPVKPIQSPHSAEAPPVEPPPVLQVESQTRSEEEEDAEIPSDPSEDVPDVHPNIQVEIPVLGVTKNVEEEEAVL